MCSLGTKTLHGELDALQVPTAREISVLLTIHFIIGMIWWTGLAPWELNFEGCSSINVWDVQLGV